MSSFNKLIATYNITQDLFEDPWYGFVTVSNSAIQDIVTSAELNGVTIENFNGYVDLLDLGFSAAGEYVLTVELNTDTLPGYIFDIRNMPPILTSVVVPPCVKYIGQAAFNGNFGLTNITLPYGLLTIGGGAFNDAGFSTITIPSTIERIDDNAFNLSGNSGLSEFSVVINAEIPPVLDDYNQGTFSPLNKLRGIYVPPGTAEAYKNAERWSYYSDYIFEQYVNPMRKNWVDITTIDNNTPFYDVAWSFSAVTDNEISFGDRWFAERPGLVTDDMGWGGGGAIEMGRYGFHRFNCPMNTTNFYTSNFDETDTDPYDIPNCGYTISVGDTWINTLPNVETISGTPCYCLGLREWVNWKPLYGAYSGMSTMFEPGNIFVQLASSGATNKNIADIRIGNAYAQKVYMGNDVVWLPEYYVEENNGTIHGLVPSPYTPGPVADFEMDHNGSFTLYHNGEVLTAQSAVYQVIERCGEGPIQVKEQRFLDDYAVQNVCAGCQYPTSTGKKRIIIGYTGNYEDNTLVVEANIFYCSGSTGDDYFEV